MRSQAQLVVSRKSNSHNLYAIPHPMLLIMSIIKINKQAKLCYLGTEEACYQQRDTETFPLEDTLALSHQPHLQAQSNGHHHPSTALPHPIPRSISLFDA